MGGRRGSWPSSLSPRPWAFIQGLLSAVSLWAGCQHPLLRARTPLGLPVLGTASPKPPFLHRSFGHGPSATLSSEDLPLGSPPFLAWTLAHPPALLKFTVWGDS